MQIQEHRRRIIPQLQRILYEKTPSFFENIYPGFSEKASQNLFNQDKEHTQRNTLFSSKGVFDVQARNHIDLMRDKRTEMRAEARATSKGKKYRYVLTTEDVFSHFVWPRPPKGISTLL